MSASHSSVEETIVKFAASLGQLKTAAEEEKLLDLDIPKSLLLIVSNVGKSSCDIVEEVLHALVSLSRSEKGSRKIMESDGALIISQLVLSYHHQSNIILFGSRILSSIASLPGAQFVISNKVIPCLVLVMEKIVHIKDIAPSAVAQVFETLGEFGLTNDSNKILISSASIAQTSTLILEQRNDATLLGACATMIANTSFKNPNAAHNFLVSGVVDRFIQKSKDNLSLGIHDDELERAMVMIGNVPNSKENSSLTYSIAGIVDFIVHLLQESDKINVIKNASIACASMSYESPVTRRHFIHAAAIEALIDIVLRLGLHDETHEDKEESKAAEAATFALINLASDATSLQRLEDNLHDFQALIQLYSQTDSEDVLLSGAMLMSALLPSSDMKRCLCSEGRTSFVENQGGGLIFQRCMNNIFFCDEALFPEWFSKSIATLGTNRKMVEDEGVYNAQYYYEQDKLFRCIRTGR